MLSGPGEILQISLRKNGFSNCRCGIRSVDPQHLQEITHSPQDNYRSDALASVHEMMESLHDIGAITKQTMREFDETCLQPAPVMSPERIRALREREHLSQPVFARYLNVSKNLISDWERGVKRPGGAALRLLSVVEKNGIQVIS